MPNESLAYYSEYPVLDRARSKFERNGSHKTSFNEGELIPIYLDQDIMPGDTVKMDMSALVRMTTPIYPVADNCFVDIMWFFVPYRTVWSHYTEFWGENNLTAWEPEIEYEIPQITTPTGGATKGSIWDYFGLPTKVANLSVSHLPFRCYVKLWNDWFRAETCQDPAHFRMDETTAEWKQGSDYVTDAEYGGKHLKAN
ncbi:MAG: hypothetical protein HUJ63_02475, partial [Enterococcus sp.]|nr:hypothetical protein [Enterococcus sp.]